MAPYPQNVQFLTKRLLITPVGAPTIPFNVTVSDPESPNGSRNVLIDVAHESPNTSTAMIVLGIVIAEVLILAILYFGLFYLVQTLKGTRERKAKMREEMREYRAKEKIYIEKVKRMEVQMKEKQAQRDT